MPSSTTYVLFDGDCGVTVPSAPMSTRPSAPLDRTASGPTLSAGRMPGGSVNAAEPTVPDFNTPRRCTNPSASFQKPTGLYGESQLTQPFMKGGCPASPTI